MYLFKSGFILFFIFAVTPYNKGFSQNNVISVNSVSTEIITGAQQTQKYLPLLKGKKVGIVANQSSIILNTSLVDTLFQLNVNIKAIFCPEHGFRGNADAGEHVANEKDSKTNLPIISLYGKNKKPKPVDLKNIDVILFDLQDVGIRFYTYISTMHYIMEACAEKKIKVIILDRPNPNGHYIDGPVLKSCCTSFVGMHHVPIVHGMTIGEYAKMINAEGWLSNGIKCDLEVITIANYTHSMAYSLPIKPSPNLPNARAVFLYPSLCFFEGTVISVGRGTDKPFQQIGHPLLQKGDITFIPKATGGASDPVLKNEVCNGFDFSQSDNAMDSLKSNQINLFILLEVYKMFPDKEHFFNNYFKLLAGNEELENQIKNDFTESEIRASWVADIDNFKSIRKKYLLYTDFK